MIAMKYFTLFHFRGKKNLHEKERDPLSLKLFTFGNMPEK